MAKSATVKQTEDFIFKVANMLRGPYRPPQYRRVMLPMTVLRRFDAVMAPTRQAVWDANEGPEESEDVRAIRLRRAAGGGHEQPLYNTSRYDFARLIGDPDGIATNMVDMIEGFSPIAKEVFHRFDFEKEVEKLAAKNKLLEVVKIFASDEIDLGPVHFDNVQMGYLFEGLIRRFNEQANEEAGDHFTPREVITLMSHLLFTGEEHAYTPGTLVTVYDPTCGTGGMLTEARDYLRTQAPDTHVQLFGQEYNDESWAICCADMLIKGEEVKRINFGDTLMDPAFEDERFHYMMANPPFGVEWKDQADAVKGEHQRLGMEGRFGAGTPYSVTDGSLLFLQHMIDRMIDPEEGEGSRIAIVFNGSPLFAAGGSSDIRRWIIESDWLEAIVALPDQLFYNTGITTYIWIVGNRKPADRRGAVQLIDARGFYAKMKAEHPEGRAFGDKRNLITNDQIREITRLYAANEDGLEADVLVDGDTRRRVVTKVLQNRAFGYLQVTTQRPLRLRFEWNDEARKTLEASEPFRKLARSNRKKAGEREADEARGRATQADLLRALNGLQQEVWDDRETFRRDVKAAAKAEDVGTTGMWAVIEPALGVRDPEAAICTKGGKPEPDSELTDTESVPLPQDIPLPLPVGYGKDATNEALLPLIADHVEAYMDREVRPHWPDAWADLGKTKVGYELGVTREFYVYEPPREIDEIEGDIENIEQTIEGWLKGSPA